MLKCNYHTYSNLDTRSYLQCAITHNLDAKGVCHLFLPLSSLISCGNDKLHLLTTKL